MLFFNIFSIKKKNLENFMIDKKKKRNKPLYKKFARLKTNIQNKAKILKFKKRKWQFLLSQFAKTSKTRKINSFYKFYDQNIYVIQKYNKFFSKNYKQTLETKKIFNLFYGTLSERYIKKRINKANGMSNKLQNKINNKVLLKEILEKRLDTVLFRSHFTLSIISARQIISHGHVFVNGLPIIESSYIVKRGDTITISPKSTASIKHSLLHNNIWPLPPQDLQISYKLLQIIVVNENKMSNSSMGLSNWLNLNMLINSYKQ